MKAQPQILVVDDDESLRFNLMSYLEDSGFDVLEASDGNRALERVRNQRPDVVLCDLRMPLVDGLDVIRTLKRDYPELPAIAISGTGVIGDAVEALREGAVDFVTKPIADMALVEHAVNRALEKSRLERENRAYQQRLERVNQALKDNLAHLELDAAAGRETQLQIMPPPQRTFGDYSFARHLQPSINLSGDFVDYFYIDDNHLGFYVADVSGHGISSGFVTVMLKFRVRRFVEQLQQDGDATILSPEALLAQLNRDLYSLHLDKYLTIFYGIIDQKRNTLKYSCGGHYPHPVLFDGERSAFVPGKGFPIGLFEEAGYESRTLTMPERFLLAVFSDGVLELMSSSSAELRNQRLLDAVANFDSDVMDILIALKLHPQQLYPDDITLLTVRREV